MLNIFKIYGGKMEPKVLLIGAGYWGRNWYKTIKNSQYKLAGIVDAKVNKSDFDTNVYSKIIDVKKEDYTHVIISTPASTHLEIYEILKLDGLDDNKILIEKPVGTTLEEAEQMKNCFHGFVWLHDEGYNILKEKKNSIGTPLTYETIRASMGPRIRTDISILEDYLFHDLYLFFDMFYGYEQEIPQVMSVKFDKYFDEPIKASGIDLKLGNFFYPPEVNMFSSWIYPKKERKTTIIGTMGSIIWENDAIFINRSHYEKTPNIVDIHGNEGYTLITLPNIEISADIKDNKSNLEKQLDNFINSNTSNTTNLLMKTWKLIERINLKHKER